MDLSWGSLHHLNISLTHLRLYGPFPNQVIRLGIQSLTGRKASKLACDFCNLPSFFWLHLNPLLSRLIESCGPAAVWEPPGRAPLPPGRAPCWPLGPATTPCCQQNPCRTQGYCSPSNPYPASPHLHLFLLKREYFEYDQKDILYPRKKYCHELPLSKSACMIQAPV